MVYGTGLSLGVFWLFLGASKRINKVFEKIPDCVIKGIQMGLCVILLLKAIEFMIIDLPIALVSIAIILLLLKGKKLLSAIAVLAFGILVAFLRNDLELHMFQFEVTVPTIYIPN